jgi:hypothetical protein
MFSISRVSSIADLPSPAAICCHDAGGANLVAAWIAGAPSQDFRICVEGPARAIFSNVLPGRVPTSLSAALEGARCLLSGTGWASELEYRARAEAKLRRIPAIAVLDHWVNYRPRFIRDGVEALPDLIVVADREAEMLAAKTFGEACPVVLWENRYLQDEVARVQTYAERKAAGPAARLLVLLEPIRQDWSDGGEAAEFRSLDFLLSHLAAVFPRPDAITIRLRPHPSEPASKYRPWLSRQKRSRLEISESPSLAQDLAWADVAAGLHSYALVVALESGRRAVSYLPPGAPPCSLKHDRLEHLTRLIEAAP